MMRFDKKIFKKHYGSIYFRFMYWGLGLSLLFLQCAYYPTFFGWTVSNNYVGLLAILIMIILVVVSVSGFLYFDRRRLAKNQQQWIDKNSVFYRLEKRSMLSLKKRKSHILTYQVQSIQNVKVDNRYLYIFGKIHLVDETDNSLNHYYIDNVRIPRCFTNEEKILRLSAYKF